MHEMNYLDIESPSGVFNSEEAEEAGTASRHEGDDGEKHLSFISLTLTPAMTSFDRSRCATAAFLGRLSVMNLRLLAVIQTRQQQSTSCQYKVTLSGETLYIEQDLAEALG